MAKYVLVKQQPEKIDKDCIIIGPPSFMTEIEQCVRKKPRSKVMSVNYLREIVATVGLKYGPEDFNALSTVNVSTFIGVPCETDEQTEKIVIKAFKKSYPDIFDRYLDHHIKLRPDGTKLIFFVGDPAQSTAFLKHGIDSLPSKEVELFLGKKTKKVVGKPAISAKEAEKSD